MAKKGLNINTEAASNDAASISEIAEKFFEANPFYSSILITTDGVVFDNSIGGTNAAENYISGKNISYQQFNKS